MMPSRIRAGAVASLAAVAFSVVPAGGPPAGAADGPLPRAADPGWIDEDLASAERAGAVLDGGGLRAAPGSGAPLGAPPGGASAPDALVTFPAHAVGGAVRAVDVDLDTSGRAAGFPVEARGVRADGAWTEWSPAGSAPGEPPEVVRVGLPAAVERVQVRVGIVTAPDAAPDTDGDTASLSGVRLRPVAAAEGDASALPGAAFAARVFTTRIGLVGNTTANGHKVRTNDNFAALPSRRALSAKGKGDYTVRVCTKGADERAEAPPPAAGAQGGEQDHGARGRCVYLPVWDVGPWNTKDDHWNEERQTWDDLPRGLPQAQAAYSDGHNGGRDGSGRRVTNPAGIDLADGAFRNGLRLTDNAWVHVDYLWTAGHRHRAEISATSAAGTVDVRPGPGTEFPVTGTAADAASVDVECRLAGEAVKGPNGDGADWYRIGPGDYIPAAFADGGGDAPRCGGADVPSPDVPAPGVPIPDVPAPDVPAPGVPGVGGDPFAAVAG
ncbi:hypothetical protein ACFO4E_01735 [Nocardiopsis mangrovi]|uniref:Secreted protein n=1 Tax=Nocardiopsis mangrovi TaxID=1179818 RepID=A0ABV9DRZ1_9ACTN